MGDWILLIGGLILIALGIISYTNRDLLWRIYSLEPRWRKTNPERTPEWDERARRSSFYYLAAGAIFVLLGL